ncbi:UNVERIFIED_CONTAM: hypothetical protein GTU68_015456 [Idotea baltica]|nr:hypothetical protein [Idotea baltica]
MVLTENRQAKFKETISNRQTDLTIVLENVHDPHNIGAVLRSCDAVGINEIYVVNTTEMTQEQVLRFGKSASGAIRWVTIHYFENVTECFKVVKEKYKRILATHLGEQSKDLYHLELTEPVALLFGNEHKGLSIEALDQCDGNFTIPQFGMVQSLNISVACAVTLFEVLRQRREKGLYNNEYDESKPFHKGKYDEWYEKQLNKWLI